MARFLDPPKPKAALPAEKVDKEYKSMRLKVFLGAFFGYAAYYLVRKNLSLAAPDMIADGILDAGKVGLAMSAVSIAYAFSKFVMGSVSDRSDARKFLCVGLVLSALVMMSVGLIPFGTNTALNTGVIFLLMLIVGWLSGFGWPPCGRIMAHWFSQNERSFKMSIWNVSHTIGSFSLGFLAIAGVSLAADLGVVQTWKGNFVFPAVVALVVAVFCWWAIRDTPESCGLPSVGDWRNDHSGIKSKGQAGEKLPFKVLFVDYVLKNKLLWVVAISNVAVYMVRYGIGDWAPTYLQAKGIMTAAESKVAFSVHNIVGAVGTIACGWATSKIFKGRCAPMNVICMLRHRRPAVLDGRRRNPSLQPVHAEGPCVHRPLPDRLLHLRPGGPDRRPGPQPGSEERRRHRRRFRGPVRLPGRRRGLLEDRRRRHRQQRLLGYGHAERGDRIAGRRGALRPADPE